VSFTSAHPANVSPATSTYLEKNSRRSPLLGGVSQQSHLPEDDEGRPRPDDGTGDDLRDGVVFEHVA